VNPGPGESQRFAAVAGAYEILHDPVRRARYDRTLRPSPAVRRRASGQPARPMPVDDRLPRHGILELSPYEAAHLARHPLALRDGRGQTILLPAGTRDGDRITVLRDGRVAVLTVRTQART